MPERSERTKGPDGKFVLLERNASTPPECQTREGCPKGTPDKQRSLTAQNAEAYEHYKRCRAVGRFPEDPIVEANAATIREIEDDNERRLQSELIRSLLLAGVRKASGL